MPVEPGATKTFGDSRARLLTLRLTERGNSSACRSVRVAPIVPFVLLSVMPSLVAVTLTTSVTAPTLSCVSKVDSSEGWTTTCVFSTLEKPALSMVTVYVPGSSAATR